MLYQGIAARAFERVFQLADYVTVKNASLENGLLHVDLVREIPEAKKPRQIPIGNGAKAQVVRDQGRGLTPPLSASQKTKRPGIPGRFYFSCRAAPAGCAEQAAAAWASASIDCPTASSFVIGACLRHSRASACGTWMMRGLEP